MPLPDVSPTPVVLDTNVLLDWQVFGDSRSGALWQALAEGRLRVLASPAALAELRSVLRQPLGIRWDAVRERTLSRIDQLVNDFDLRPDAVSDRKWPRCSDPTDQKFVDLALHTGARWLFTRDKALLRLHRSTRQLGLGIVEPQAWAAATASVAAG